MREIARLLAAREEAGGGGAEAVAAAESALPDDAVPSRPAEALDRAAANLVVPATQAAAPDDRAGFEAARDTVLRHAAPALAALRDGRTALSRAEECALEAVIIADGTRPSFLICGGEVATNDPFLGNWKDDVVGARAEIASACRSVGRIQPKGGHAGRFVGTGTVIDAAKGLILTNYHVIDEAQNSFGVAMTRNGRTVAIDGVLEIDFVGEACSLETDRFRIVEARLPEGYGRTFSGLDAAVCVIEPLDGSPQPPPALAQLSSAAHYPQGGSRSLALLGFPGRPKIGEDDGVDWDFVMGKLFDDKFGFKRLAPGTMTMRLGSHPADTTKTALGHNATTFGGASGALVLAWQDSGPPAFALHFGGATEKNNYALAFAAAQQALEAIGVRFA